MNNYKIEETTKKFYNDSEMKDVARLGFAENVGLKEIALAIVSEKTGLWRYELDRIMVTNGTQVCFAYDAQIMEKAKDSQWVDSYWSTTESGNVVVRLDPDGEDKYYRIDFN